MGVKKDGTIAAEYCGTSNKTDVSSWRNIKEINAGFSHTMGIKDDGTVVYAGHSFDDKNTVENWENIKSIVEGFSLR